MTSFVGFCRWLARAHPASILALYAGVIFGFGVIYTLISRQYYHAYVRYEPSSREAKAALEAALGRAIETDLQARPDLGDSVRFFMVRWVAIRGERDRALLATAEIAASIPHENDDGATLYFLRVPLEISPLGFRGRETEGPERLATVHFRRDAQQPIDDVSILAHDPEEREIVMKAVGLAVEGVPIDADLRSRLSSGLDTEMGFPGSTAGTLGRMLYYSAITITTVGYGDIVPLTGLARFLAALEATLGIILLGLLVNGISRWAEAQGPSPKP